MLCHDPRVSNIRWELYETHNVALIHAHFASQGGEFVDWDEVATATDDCDWPRDGNGRVVPGDWAP